MQQTRADRIQDRLASIMSDLRRMSQSRRVDPRDIMQIKEQLHNIDEEYQDACIHENDGSIAPGQAIISELLAEAHELSSDLLEETSDDDDYEE
ncbi:hypothetical protein BC829DRAFT_444379 [Chytridium lagenaria]|nr:hypothetical protein BC829DRAFT_444379 [Chytridium lagenaria]